MLAERSAPREAGFTLIELLIVIGIIAVLAGLITTSVTMVRQRAKKANAAAGIKALQLAISAYDQITGFYPNAHRGPEDNPEALFRGLYAKDRQRGGSGENHLEDWSPQDMGVWGGSYLPADGQYQRPNPQSIDQAGARLVLLDPWGHPYHYVEWKSHPPSQRQLSGGNFEAQGSLPYMIWSNGPDGENHWGLEDDIASWTGTSQ